MTFFSQPSGLPRLARTSMAIVLLGVGLSACAPLMIGGAVTGAMVATDRRTSGAQLDDQGIELRGSNRLSEQLGERGNVSVTSFNRQVLLTGEVSAEKEKQIASQVMAGVENVRSVVNEIGVRDGASFKERTADTLVTTRIKASILDARDLFSNAFKVVTSHGTVYLMGRVTQREADRVTDIARNTTGVQRVVRVMEIISEEELARVTPTPPEAPKPTSASPTPAN
jgi:osmotically-inducible protein OsmY